MGEEAGLGAGPGRTFSFDNADRVKQIIGSVQTDGSYISKESAIGDLKVVEWFTLSFIKVNCMLVFAFLFKYCHRVQV